MASDLDLMDTHKKLYADAGFTKPIISVDIEIASDNASPFACYFSKRDVVNTNLDKRNDYI